MLFDYDWWFGAAYQQRIEEAKRRCTRARITSLPVGELETNVESKKFLSEVETRTIIYLRDSFSYELKELIDQRTTGSLTFECAAADEAYKVGAFVVTVPFDEIARVEIFAVHPREKPEDMVSIKGFASPPGGVPGKRPDDRQGRSESPE